MRGPGSPVRPSLLGAFAVLLAVPLAPDATAQCVPPGAHAGTIAANETWCGGLHTLTDDVTVAFGVTLTLQPGVTIQAPPNVELKILGNLLAPGTAAQPIEMKGDAGGQWTGLIFDGSAGPGGGTGTLSYCTIRQGDNASSIDPYRGSMVAKDVGGAGVSFTSCTFSERTRPAWVVRSRVSFASCTFSNASQRPLTVEGASTVLDLTGCTFTGNAVNRVFLANGALTGQSFTLKKQAQLDAYYLEGRFVIPAGITLTVEPGVTLVGLPNEELKILGHLEAVGTAADPITFTAADGVQWTGLIVAQTGSANLVRCVVEKGGNSTSVEPYRASLAVVDVQAGTVNVSSSTIGTSPRGAWVVRSRASFAGATFTGAASWPLTAEGASTVLDLTGNTFTGNGQDRVYLANGALTGQSFALKKQTQLDAYYLEGRFVIPAGITLTVEPGVKLVGLPNEELKILGHLEAVGTAADPITFTAADGVQWTGLIVAQTGSANLVRCVVEKGGNSTSVEPYRASLAVVGVQTGPVTVADSTITGAGRGAWVADSRVSFAGTTFTGASSWPLLVAGASSVLDLTGCAFTGSPLNWVYLVNGALTGQSFTLRKQTQLDAYYLEGRFVIPAGMTLTLEPGVKVVGYPNEELKVLGHLEAVGTAADPITFTAADGVQWTGLIVAQTGSANLVHCLVEKGDNSTSVEPYRASLAIVGVQTGTVSVRASTIRGRSRGAWVAGSRASFTDTTFTGAWTMPLTVEGPSTVLSLTSTTFTGNTPNRVFLRPGAMMGGDPVLTAQNGLEAYQIETDFEVPAGRTLTFGPGTTLTANANEELRVRGRLEALGTPTQPVRFTSLDAGQWTGLAFDGGTGLLRHALVERGGNASSIDPYRGGVAARDVTAGSVVLESSRVTGSAWGIRGASSAFELVNTVVSDNAQWGILLDGGSLSGTHVTIARNGSGVGLVTAASATLTSALIASSALGVSADASASALLRATHWDAVGTKTSGPVTQQGWVDGSAAFAADGWHVTASSAGVGQGFATPGVLEDVDGETRPRPAGTLADIGADEVDAGSGMPGRSAAPIGVGESRGGTAPAGGFSDFLLQLAPGQVPNLRVRLEAPSGVASLRLLVRARQFPLATFFDADGVALDATTREVLIPAPLAGAWYLAALSTAGAVSFTISVAGAQRGLASISPASGGNAGSVVAGLDGVGFVPGVRVELRRGGAPLRSYAPVDQTATRLTVPLDLRGLAPGTCDVAAVWPDGEAHVLASAFVVLAGGQATLETEMILPGAVRAGRPATLVLVYRNAGTIDMPAPLLEVRSVQNVPMRLAPSYAFQRRPFRVLAIGSGTGTAATLSPGDTRTIPFQVIPEGPAHAALDFQVHRVDDASRLPIAWPALEAELRSPEIDDDAWTRLWALFQADVGARWAEWVTALRGSAGALSANRRFVFDPARLVVARMTRLAGYGVPTNLSIALDADAPSPGPPLGVLRSYPNSILSRSRLGPFGRGWRNALWETTLTVAPTGEVVVRGGSNELRRFWPRTDGGYDGMTDDPGRLVNAAAGFSLTETDLTVLSFRPDGRLASIVDRFGNRADLTYDASSRLTRVSHTTGDHLDLLWNAQGRVTQLTDHGGRVTSYGYDATGELLTSVTSPGGRAWRYAYAPVTGSPSDRALTSITLPDGTHRIFDYDAAGRLARRSGDGGSDPISFGYATLARMTSTDGAGSSVVAAFDEIGRLVGAGGGSGAWGWLTHDSRGNVVRATGPDGAEADLDYGPVGDLAHLVDPLGNEAILRRVYTAGGGVFVRGLVDPMTNTSSISLGPRHEPTSLVLPDGSRWELAADAMGEYSSVRNRRGQTILTTHNARGQVVRKDVPGAGPILYDYDAAGRPARVTGPEGAYVFEYDAREFLVRLTEPSGRVVSWEYDDGGKKTRRTTSDGAVVTYGWDGAGRLSEVRLGDGSLLSRYSYDAAGRLARQDRGNGTSTTWEYDGGGTTRSIVHRGPGGALQDSLVYERDPAGRPVRMTSPAGLTSWTWDALGRLVRVDEPSGRVVTYAYDAAGNRTAVVDDGVSTPYVSNALNQVTTAGAASFTYDADGNVVTRTDASGTTTYEWDPEGRLVRVAHPTAGVFQYTYDSLGRLASEARGAATTRFSYDDGALESERDGAGALVARYAAGYGLLARLPAAGSAAFYAFDLAGSTRIVTDVTGAVVNRYELGPFGEPRTAVEGLPNPFRTSGAFGVRTEAHGLVRMGARPYDPSLGRFLAPDPLGYLAGYNLYAYCGNSPVQNADPTGLEKIDGDIKMIARNLKKSLMSALGEKGLAAFYGLINAPEGVKKGLKEAAEGWKKGDAGMVSHGLGSASWAFGSSAGGTAVAGMEFLLDGTGTIMLGGVALGPVLAIVGVVIVADEIFTDLYLEDVKSRRAFLERGPAPRNAYAMWPDQIRPDGTLPPELLALWRHFHGMDVVQPGDPNEKLGTPGTGTPHLVEAGTRLTYNVRFENVPTASAPAQEVVVDDVLDANLDLGTFRLREVGWGEHVLAVTTGATAFAAREVVPDWRPTDGRRWWVDVAAELDGSGKLRVVLRTIDPATFDLPEDPYAGFLPPEDGTGRGQGWVVFDVATKSPLPDGTRITNDASIVFDTQPALTTNEVFNTIGRAAAPSAVVTAPSSLCANAVGTASVTTSVALPAYQWTITVFSGSASLTGPTDGPSVGFKATSAGSFALACAVRDTSTGLFSVASAWVTAKPAPTPLVTAPTSVPPGATGLVASVPSVPGDAYAWTITNGTITAGQGTSQVTFTAGPAGPLTLSLVETGANGCASLPSVATVAVQPPAGPCVPGSSTLCLGSGRFRAVVEWKDYTTGATGSGHAVALTSESGYFWFFAAANLELFLKVLDGRAVNGSFWVMYGALSDVEYTVTVTDTRSGAVKVYQNPAHHLASVADVTAFPDGSRSVSGAAAPGVYGVLASRQLRARDAAGEAVPAESPRPTRPASVSRAASGCTPGPTTLCALDGRFEVSVAWRNYTDGRTGPGRAVPLTIEAGVFWFFSESNVELAVKVLDGRGVNGKFWVMSGALTDVEYTILVRDTETGAARAYDNPPHTLASFADTSAF